MFKFFFGHAVNDKIVGRGECLSSGMQGSFGWANEHMRHDDEGFFVGDKLVKIGGGNIAELAGAVILIIEAEFSRFANGIFDISGNRRVVLAIINRKEKAEGANEESDTIEMFV